MRLLFLLLSTFCLQIFGQTIQYEKSDSVKVEQLLASARQQDKSTNMVIYFARQLIGTPYIAKTLENNDRENLVINLRELDCTTYVENVLALFLCHKNHQKRFQDFCQFLRLVRYRNGKVAYPNRLHYFSSWIEDNVRMGYIRHVEELDPPFSATQVLDLHYMTTHPQYYPMMKGKPEVIAAIREMEIELTGNEYLYIPKDSIRNTPLLRRCIKDGDILAMLTSRKGLDTSHVGIAIWHDDGLHLLNASSIHGKVVEEPMTLNKYMSRQRLQIGIRAVRCAGQ